MHAKKCLQNIRAAKRGEKNETDFTINYELSLSLRVLHNYHQTANAFVSCLAIYCSALGTDTDPRRHVNVTEIKSNSN